MKKRRFSLLAALSFLLLLVQCHRKETAAYTYDGSSSFKVLNKLFQDSVHIAPTVVIDRILGETRHAQDSAELGKMWLLLSQAYYYATKLDSALLTNQAVIDLCAKATPSERIESLEGEAYNNRGVFLQEADLKDSAIICYHKAYNCFNAIRKMETIPSVCTNLANCYFMNGNYIQTSNYYRRALFIVDSLGQGQVHHHSIYSGLAQLYQEIGNYNLAEEYFSKAETYWDTQTAYQKYFFANTRGNYFYRTESYPQALEWFRKAYTAAQTLTQAFPQVIVTSNLGEIFILLEESDSARHYLNTAKELLGENYYQPSLRFYIDGLYASLALLENNLPEAERLLTQPYDTASVNPSYIYFHNKRMQNLYEKKQDYKRAYQYQRIAIEYSDSLHNTKVHNNIAETEFRFQQDTTLLRKDLQIVKSKHEAKQWKRATVLSMAIFALFALLLVVFILYRRRIQELKQQRQLATITNLRMEIVRNRLSPHFVFNALNAILPSLDKYAELVEPFRLLIRLLRNSLQASERISVCLDDEIRLVKDYLQLQLLRGDQNISVSWQVDSQVPADQSIPSMSIQIPVENAVKYAFADAMPNPAIEIRISSDEENVYISIEDNGIGYMPGQLSADSRGTGNGIKMLHKTVSLLNSQNEKEIVFRIENLSRSPLCKQGTKVSLVIPLKYKFDVWKK